MPRIDAPLIVVILGPMFLMVGVVRCVIAGRLAPDGRTWLIVGTIFLLVAWWLWR